MQLFGKTLGVIGLGGIGREVARIAKGIGMDVIAIIAPCRRERAAGRLSIDTFWRNRTWCRCISRLGDGARGFLSAARIAKMNRV